MIGAGAAGLMCAIEAGRRGRRTLVLEHSGEIGRKILISGGGRCNFTNIHTRAENFISANPHFAKSALARYQPADFIALVEKHGIRYHEKTLGQLFCDGSAREIVELLRAECEQAGVRIETSRKVTAVRSGFVVSVDDGELGCESLVIATGGLSIPKLGASGFGYGVAEQFGLRVRPCHPALVPLVFGEEDKRLFADLAGVSAAVKARAEAGPAFAEKLLFTHRGLSGPVVLQVSSYWKQGESVTFDFGSPDLMAQKRAGARAVLRTALAETLPRRLAERWVSDDRPLAEWRDQELRAVEESLRAWRVNPAGTEGYEKAEVTCGGVDTDELSSKTMEAKNVPGLFFAGEVTDVTGQLGGYNFQWAWASGFVAGGAV